MMKVIKKIVLILFLGLTMTFTGFAGEVDPLQDGKKRETPKERRKDQPKDDRGDRDGKRDSGKDKKDKRKND